MTTSHISRGQLGELYAAAFLEQSGYNLVAANFTLPVGRNRRDAVIKAELDLLAYDGPILCFVEVKTRASDWFASPEINVDRRKRRQIARGARAYRQMFDIEDEPYRFDVVTVVLGDEQSVPQIELLKSFWTEAQLKRRWQTDRYYD
jgi:putative endonuclease